MKGKAHKFGNELEVLINQSIVRLKRNRLVIMISDIVHTNPEREDRVSASPWRRLRFVRELTKELRNLICERVYSSTILGNEGFVDDGSAVCEIVGENERVVVLDCGVIDPINTACSCLSLSRA